MRNFGCSKNISPCVVLRSYQLDLMFFRGVNQVVASTCRECHHSQRWMLISGGHKASASEDEEICDIVRLTERIQYAGFRIGAHPATSHFVNQTTGNTH